MSETIDGTAVVVRSEAVGQPTPSYHFTEFFQLLRRYWFYPLVGSTIGLAIALTILALTPDVYKSTGRLVIDKSVNRYLQSIKVIDEPTSDAWDVSSQIYVLSSESIIIPVVRSMNLTRDAEFVGQVDNRAAEPGSWSISALKQTVMRALGRQPVATVDGEVARERRAVEAFLKRLSVYREDVANVITISFESQDPKKAADIVNALVDTYLAAGREIKMNSTGLAGKMLNDRLQEVKQQLVDAERAVLDYRIAQNLSGSQGSSKNAEHLTGVFREFIGQLSARGPIQTDQLTGLGTHLTNARFAMMETKAKLQRIEQSTHGTSIRAEVPDNETITRLRTQLLELNAKATELAERAGAKHVATLKMRKRVEEIQSAIREEQQQIVATLKRDYELALMRNDEVAKATTEMLQEMERGRKAEVSLRQLESSAEVLRTLYSGYLQKASELNRAQEQALPVQDVRVISRAAPPLTKSARKSVAILGGGFALGLLLGMGAALSREWGSGVFRTSEQVRRATQLNCVVMPTVESRRSYGLPLLLASKPTVVDEHVVAAPYSRFTESVRFVKAMVEDARRNKGQQVFCVLSSVVGEGKTTVTANLATLLAMPPKRRVLVIDGDLHHRGLTSRLAPDAREGLIEALADPDRLGELAVRRERTGVFVLPCVLTQRIASAADLLGSPEMERLLEAARASFDLIVIEVPPAAPVVDVRMVERLIDQFIFVVEWGRTKQRLVDEVLQDFDAMRDRLLCVVLNKADPATMRIIDSYKGSRYGDYYVG